MSIVRVKKKRHPFVTVDKTAYLDQRMTWQARGMHIYLMCRPDNWKVQIADLINQTPDVRGQGKEAVQAILKELEGLGYVARVRARDPETKQFKGWETLVFETPEDREDWGDGGNTPDNPFNPSSGSTPIYQLDPSLAKPTTGSTPPLINKEFPLINDQNTYPPTPQGEPDPGVCVEESPTALGTEPEQTEPLATLPVQPEVIGTPQDSEQDKRSAAPKANPDRDKVWGGRFKHPAEAMEARFAAGGNAPSRNNFAALQAEGMYGLVALGDEAWEVVRVVDGRVEFTELARAGARSISPDDVPEARVLRHLVNQSRKGTRTDWQILLDAGREAMAKKAQAEQVAVAREQQVVALPFQGDGYEPMAYAKMLNDRVMGAVAPVSVQAQKEAEPDAESDSASTDCADGTVPDILARMYSAGGNGIQVRAARIGLARTLVVEHGIDLEDVRLAVLDDLAAGLVARETAVTILRETLQTTDVAARIQAMAAQQPHNPHLAEPRVATPEPAPVDQDAILNFLQPTEDESLPELIETMEEKLKLLGLRTPFEQETWLVEHGQPYNWRGLAANQLKALITFVDNFPNQLAS